MRMAKPALIAFAALAVLAAPAIAKNSKAPKADAEETSETSPSCHSYQFGPDGNMTQVPCQEMGPNSSSQHRAAPKGHDAEAH